MGADQLDATVPGGEREHAGKNANVHYGEKGQPRRFERDASGHFPDHEWQRRERRDGAENKNEAHPVHRRALAQVNGVDGKDHHVEHDDDVPPVELQVSEVAQLTLRDDHQHADRRYEDAAELNRRDAVVEYDSAGGDDEHGHQRVEHGYIERCCVLQTDILSGGEERSADDAEPEQDTPVRADHRPIALDVREREDPERNSRQQPAHRRDADRRNLAANGAADDVVAGPEQRGERQQDVGIVVNPAAPGLRFFFFTGHGRASQQSRAARTAAAVAKPISAILPSTTRSGKACSASGASRIAAPPPITAAYHGTSIQAAAIPATTEPAVTTIEVHNTIGPEP